MHLDQPSSPSPGLRSQVPHQKICHPSPWRCDKGIAQRLSLAAAVLAAFLYRSRCWSIGRMKPGALPTSFHSHPLPELQPSLLGFPLAWPTKHYMVIHQFSPSPPPFWLLSQPHQRSLCYLTSEGDGELAPPPHQAPLRKTTATVQKSTDAAAPCKVRLSLIQWQKIMEFRLKFNWCSQEK